LNALSMLQESYFMMRRRLSQLSVELYKPDYVINIPHNIAGIWDYDKASFMIEKGKELTDKVVPDVPIKKKEAMKKNKSPKEKEKEKEVV